MGATEQLKDKVIIITGASSGIGEATAAMLAQAGANIVLAARRRERLETLAKNIARTTSREPMIVVADVSRRDDVTMIVDKTLAKFQHLDAIVNNAGVMPLSYMKSLHVEEWEKMIDINIKGVLYGIAAALPVFLKQKSGHIVNVGSVAGRRVFEGGAVYSATKFAVRAISEGLRMELGPKENVKVTVIAPGAVKTELPNYITDQDYIKNSVFSVETLLESEDVAASILYSLTQHERVNVDEIIVMPRSQGH